MQQITLRPCPPFVFALPAAVFSAGDPYIRSFRRGVFRQLLDTGTGLVLADIRSTGTYDTPELSLSLSSDYGEGRANPQTAAEQVAAIFSTNDDLIPFYRAVAGDPVLSVLTARLRGVRVPVTPTVFEALTDSIIEQQFSLAAARSIKNRLIRATGKTLSLDNSVYYCYPGPSVLAKTTETTFRSCGLTIRKGEYIRDISRQVVAGELDIEGFRDYMDTEQIIDDLVKIRGIGRWTAELTILRGLHRPDAFPADDVGIRRFISEFYLSGRKITAAEARIFSERWGAWKGFAAYYLEVADHLGIDPAG
ncbi:MULTISPECIES: DNA-3-methyladenine glycosylase [unclassified Methanoregula]|uniref:DNA-3-methyladenine glycosylase family protein n=1 Tax=unclassified Methanoregula TaxID=2649730 RepID=UPI0009C63A3D|nr:MULTISPECIES: DNA-3-methyladenine glycosylase [unclassified Methanoregula]OPX63648.1 MAG: 3-methyl-adenine DNA glycosylase II [Methanoregula sp. PtaB.Bin085]OPY36186.1 MAG: 3-methyl-adenine DNA glycosylase II [Methanoregula sp. PtaU1.Bin006]